MTLPYETATHGESALAEVQKTLSRFGCETYGITIDAERGCTVVRFKHTDRAVTLEAHWQGYAAAWLAAFPYGKQTRCHLRDYELKALRQARTSVAMILRDLIRAQVTAVECGVMSFEAAFMNHPLSVKNGASE